MPSHASALPRLARTLLGALALAVLSSLPVDALAASPVPIVLPPSQRPDDWADALAAHGLTPSKSPTLPESGPAVMVIDRNGYWEMTVRDWSGKIQIVNMSPAASPEEREDLLFYLSTLLGEAPPELTSPVKADPVAKTEPAKTEPAKTEPAKTTPVAKTEPAKTTPVAKTEPAKTPPAKTEPAKTTPVAKTEPAKSTTTVPRASGGTGPWVQVGGGVGYRPTAGIVGALQLDGGVQLNVVRVGAGFGMRTNSGLVAAGNARTMSDWELVVEGAWAPSGPGPIVGLYGGAARRNFTDEGETVVAGFVPIVGLELGVDVPLGKAPLHLVPDLRAQIDARQVELRAAGSSAVLSPIEARLGLTLLYR